MYILTFYSFKGGVGRTMALLNVAAELVQTGRRVLIVDFDLEAPGVDSYKLPKEGKGAAGLVEYVSDYIRSGTAPKFDGHFFESVAAPATNGRLWVMPSGTQDDSYGGRLARIDWQKLYSEQDGYLLFENLKNDWYRTLAPDYVLIDSRTGHTDEAGICTRQLPDAVALFFHPDEQNRRGLEQITKQIRQEAFTPRAKRIDLYFVMSNVPDLDDEDRILADSMKRCQESLGYLDLTATIHRYNSLALLNGSIFTRERPKSRLAAEYRTFVREIVRNNIDDHEGSLQFLAQLVRPSVRSRQSLAADGLEKKLNKIQEIHASSSDVLLRIAEFRRKQQRFDEALELLNRCVSLGMANSQIFLMRAEVHQSQGKTDQALSDALRVLKFPDEDYVEVNAALAIIRKISPSELKGFESSPAIQSLSLANRFEIRSELQLSGDTLPYAEALIRSLRADKGASFDDVQTYNSELAVVLIGQGCFSDAISLIQANRANVRALKLQDRFNLAIATWGLDANTPVQLFRDALAIFPETDGKDPNFFQCLSLAWWAVGDAAEAQRWLERSANLSRLHSSVIFSAWQYLRIPAEQFRSDLDLQARLIQGQPLCPPVIAPRSLFDDPPGLSPSIVGGV